MMLHQLIVVVNTVCQKMGQANVSSLSDSLPDCYGKSQSLSLSYKLKMMMCFASIRICPGTSGMRHLDPLSFWAKATAREKTREKKHGGPAFGFDSDSGNALTVNASGFVVQTLTEGSRPVAQSYGITTTQAFGDSSTKYFAFEVYATLPHDIRHNSGMNLFQMTFAPKNKFYGERRRNYGPGTYQISVNLDKGVISVSACHNRDIVFINGRISWTLKKRPKIEIRVIHLLFGLLFDHEDGQIMFIDVEKGEVVVRFQYVVISEPLWILLEMGSMDWTRLNSRQEIQEQLKTSVAGLQQTWKLTSDQLLV